MAKIHARWSKVATDESLQRSSHCLGVINGKGYIFGGELQPRQPRDNKIFQVNLDAKASSAVEELSSPSAGPCARIGATATTLDDKLYIFSGRGGEAMHPIDENGALWVFDPSITAWSQVSLTSLADFHEENPPPRSYHCSTSDGKHRIYIHGGCPTSGRLSDLWSWHAPSRAWSRHADAPSPARGGPSIAWHGELLYRMNGFDGKTEQGGALDIFSLSENSWTTKTFHADGISGPAPRSVGTLLPVTINGIASLLTLFGEGDPSSLGHAGAGKMFGDVWAWNIQEESWTKVETTGEIPVQRGWFDADVINQNSVFISGGLGESNERLDDAWILSFE